MPSDLHKRIKAYSEDRKISLSDALRRLLYTGLRADIDDPTDISRALASVRSDVHEHTSDLIEIHVALEDLKCTLERQHEAVQSLSAFSELVTHHSEPVLKILCELLLISRIEMNARSERAYDDLAGLFPKQYELFKAAIAEQIARRGGDRHTPTPGRE